MLFFVQNVFYTWKYDRLFPSVKNILNKEKYYMSGMSNMRPAGRMSCVALMTTQMRPIWLSGDPRFDMPDVTDFDITKRGPGER
jgi:hypothetical protein